MLKIGYHSLYAHPLPESHRFPMLKYELIPGQLLHEGTITPENIFTPEPCPEEFILWTHDAAYWNELNNLSLTASHIRRIGFPLTRQLVQREIVIAQGTIDCCLHAMQYGISLNVAGGTHHAFANRGEGFCLLNDMAIAANYLLRKKLAKQILVVDVDVHQGNGTAAIFEHEPRVFTFSMHGGHNYPFIKEKSDLDVALADGTTDEVYLNLLNDHLHQLIQKLQPDFLLVVSGVDILSSDKFGKLNVSMEGCRQRDRLIFELAHTHKIPCAVAMGGGYSADIRIIVEAHCNTFREAKHIFDH
ncbi:MAG TPA: histone deacetylase [Phnomibacter sp.]|nr:histone deacetylase [Phnomibacter sp.]